MPGSVSQSVVRDQFALEWPRTQANNANAGTLSNLGSTGSKSLGRGLEICPFKQLLKQFCVHSSMKKQLVFFSSPSTLLKLVLSGSCRQEPSKSIASPCWSFVRSLELQIVRGSLTWKRGSPLGGCQKTQPSQNSGEGRICYLQQVRRGLGVFPKAASPWTAKLGKF